MLPGVIAFGGFMVVVGVGKSNFVRFRFLRRLLIRSLFVGINWCRVTPLIVRRRSNNDYAGIFNAKGAGSHATYLLSDFQESTLVGPHDERTACAVSISGWRHEGLQASCGRGGNRSAGVSRIRHRWPRCGFARQHAPLSVPTHGNPWRDPIDGLSGWCGGLTGPRQRRVVQHHSSCTAWCPALGRALVAGQAAATTAAHDQERLASTALFFGTAEGQFGVDTQS